MTKKGKARKGGLRIDPSVREWLKNAAENPAALTAKQRRDRKRQRAIFDLPRDIQEVLRRVARKEDTSISQVVEMLLVFGLNAYIRGEESLREAFWDGKTPARTPRFSWNIEPPDEWLERLTKFLAKEKG